MRIVLHSEIVPGSVDEYVARHARIPEELSDSFARIGIHGWTIWRSGHRLFHLVDCDDWDAAVRELDEDIANAAWQAHIGPVVLMFRDAGGGAGMAPLDMVWSLEDQRADPRHQPDAGINP